MIRLFLPFFKWCERVFVSILVLSLVVPMTLMAYFSDTEVAKDQGFLASELQLLAFPDLAEDTYLGVGLTPESMFTLPSDLTTSSTKSKFDFVSHTSGDSVFCDALRLSASGYIGTISGAASSFATSDLNPGGGWDFKLKYDNDEVLFTHGDTCLVTITAEFWQENMNKETAGYRDSYTYVVPVTAHLIVLNEVLAKPNSGEREFIELYNNSDLPINVAGWNITERTGSGNIVNHIVTSSPVSAGALVAYDDSLSTIVPPRGFLALKYNSSAYLNDSGDSLMLIDTSGVVVDEYSYTNAQTNKSDARIPDGVGAWVDPVPTPNEPNLEEVIEEGISTSELSIELMSGQVIEEMVEATATVSVVDENEFVELIEIEREAGETESAVKSEEVSTELNEVSNLSETSTDNKDSNEIEDVTEEITENEPTVEETVVLPVKLEEVQEVKVEDQEPALPEPEPETYEEPS